MTLVAAVMGFVLVVGVTLLWGVWRCVGGCPQAETAGLELEELDAKEEKVVRLRFGLNGADPKTLKEIGEQLYIAPKTVENHVRNILSKLHLNRRQELTWPQYVCAPHTH